MRKFFSLFFLFVSFTFAKVTVLENRDFYTLKKTSTDFETTYANVKDEVIFRGFQIVYELDLGKSTKNVAKYLKKDEVLTEGKNIGMCKSSFTYTMVKENFNNTIYCPISLSVYKKAGEIFYTFRKYKPYNKNDEIFKEVNKILKEIGEESF